MSGPTPSAVAIISSGRRAERMRFAEDGGCLAGFDALRDEAVLPFATSSIGSLDTAAPSALQDAEAA